MASKSCLARGIERNHEPEGVAKLTRYVFGMFSHIIAHIDCCKF